MEKKVPMRTCIACRSVKPKKELVRIVKTNDGIILDYSGKVNGRGAYVCNSAECMEKLKKNKLLNKTFSCNVDDATYQKLLEALLGK